MPFPSRRTITRSLAIPLILLGTSTASRADINWLSSFFASNRDSTGSDLNEGYIFYLGVFNPPPPGSGEAAWTPTPANTNEWTDHWITADAVVYNSLGQNFSSRYFPTPVVEGVNLTGKQAYIWGVNRRHPEAEWLLVTNPVWSWPTPEGSIDSFPQYWAVGDSIAVLGQVDQGGVHMQFASVTNSLPPLVRPAIWLQTYFSQQEIDNQQATLTGWTSDPDNDQIPNILEFACGTHPRVPDPPHPVLVGATEITGQTYQTLTVSVDPHADLTMAGEVSAELVHWFEDGAHVVIESQSPSQITFRDLTPRSPANPFRAIRFRASLP